MAQITLSDHTLIFLQVDIPATVDEVRKIIMSCDLDPLPTTLLKTSLDTLLYPITSIVNASLCSGLFLEFKTRASQPIS